MRTYYDNDIDSGLILNSKVAVIGYGSQGHAHALNLRDSGVNVKVGLQLESQSRDGARAAGLEVDTTEACVEWADVVMFCTPDVTMRFAYQPVEHKLREGKMLLFAHGFNVHFGLINPPRNIDVALVAPKGPGHRLRAEYLAGSGLAALVGVHFDATGRCMERALSYAWGIGCGKGGVMETSFREETETDLFGEQAVLCGGLPELIKAGFDTLVEAGYQPEAAYFECLHETKLIVDLLYEGGLTYMRYAISDTAEWGGFTAGPKVINEGSRAAMKQILADIQSGKFAAEWIAEDANGRPTLGSLRRTERALLVEEVGARLRSQMPFIAAKNPPQTPDPDSEPTP